MNTQDILDKLDEVKEVKPGEYMALCPAHDDTNPSLHITETDDKTLFHCFGGCGTAAVLEALKITERDLFKDNPGVTTVKKQYPKYEQSSLYGGQRKLVASYPFTDESGNVLYIEQKFDPKGFITEYPNGQKTDRRVLYRLPELIAADLNEPVLLVEGCKDVETALRLGFVATTNAFGARSWEEDYNQHLKGRWVVIIGDNDETGQRRAAILKEKLDGVAARLTVIESLPNVGEGGDLTDWVETGGNAEKLKAIINLKEQPNDYAASIADFLEGDYKVEYLVDKLIPKGALVFITADPFRGKTILTYNLATDIAQGKPFLGRKTKEAKVLLIPLEDGKGLIKKRLLTMGVPTENIYIAANPRRDNKFEHLEDFILAYGIELVIIDPFAFVESSKDENAAKDITCLLDKFKGIIERTGATIILVHHHNKGGSFDQHAIRGSTGIQAAADVLLQLFPVGNSGKVRLKMSSRYNGNDEIKLKPNSETLRWELAEPQTNEQVEPKEAKEPTVAEKVERAMKVLSTENNDELTRYLFPQDVSDPEKFQRRKNQVRKEKSNILKLKSNTLVTKK